MSVPRTTKREVTMTVTEVTVTQGHTATATIRVKMDDRHVAIPVAPEIKAYWEDQFFRENPTPLQKKRFATLMSIVRAAYSKGLADGANKK